MADITMPQLGETVTEGTITKWFKKVGDQVAEDEPLFEVSTDKVDSEVPSSAAGYLTEIRVQEGETVDVGVTLAVITADQSAAGAGAGDRDGAPSAAAEAPADGGAGTEAASRPEAPGTPPAAAAPAAPEAPAAPPAAAAPAAPPAAAALAAPEAPAAGGQPEGNGRGGGGNGPSDLTAGRLLSPVVRRLVNEHGLDPEQIPGTGQGGRVTRGDVLAYIDRSGGRAAARQGAGASQAAPPAASPAATAKPVAVPRAGGDDEVIAFSNIRKRTAEHMIRSQATSAHVLVATEVDFWAVDQVRAAHKEQFKAREGFSLTYLPFIARATIDAIAEFPHVNASVGDNQLIVHRRTHLAIAVDLNFEGLIVPVVHDADQLRLTALARSIADLARRARSRELTADDISGGTITITNPGPFGTFITFPVINQPQVAVLSTDGIRKKPVAIELPDGSDAVAVHPVGVVGLSFDHRAFDGAYASAFVARIKDIIETRDWAQEL